MLDKTFPAVPSGRLFGWLSLIATLVILVLVYDIYWGKGDMFGLAKNNVKQTTV